MSEYQFYEFKSIDKPLSKEDKEKIATWSSRSNPTNSGVIFTYSYGNFPKSEIDVVEKYFDAMFYISNWGTTRLIFKFPKELIPAVKIKPYCIEYGLALSLKSNYYLLDFIFEDEEGGGGRWIEGEGWLSSLIQLRDDILNGDYRSLYLIWLKNIMTPIDNEWDNMDPDMLEPDIPQNLKELTGPLQDFIEIFDIDKDYVEAASENCQTITNKEIFDYEANIKNLNDIEKHEFIVRLLNNEPLLASKLKMRLKELAGSNKGIDSDNKRRSAGEIAERVKEMRKARKEQEAKDHQEKQLRKLTELESSQNRLWIKVYQLISEKNTKAYEEAIKILKDLKELSIYKGSLEEYSGRVEEIVNENKRLSGLTGRISDARLIKPK